MTTDITHQRTRTAFMWSRILRTPFWAIYGLMPFILLKDLDGSPFQIAAIIAIKPMVSILSMYWCAAVNKRRDRLISNIIWASILGVLPFLLFPWVNNSWFFVASCGLYMMMHRGVIPAWMEIIKLNLPGVSRERFFAYGSTFGYVGDAVLPFLFGWFLDGYFQAWRWIFPATALLSLTAILFQCKIPIHLGNFPKLIPAAKKSFSKQLLRPWKEAWDLVATRPDFRAFQIGFMIGGSALMLMQPVLPAFFMEVLDISYTELSVALTLCKGLGFALTSQIWARWIKRVDIYRFSSLVTLIAFLFPLCLIAAKAHIVWLYLAYLSYGIMQAGSELSWNMSGPIFAHNEDSSVFSSVNVATVGLRGCIVPGLGALLLSWSSPALVLSIGGVLCLAATTCMITYSRTLGKLTPQQS